jgi:hypothetical protein
VIKKALIWLVVAFAVYSVIATPDSAAAAVRSAGHGGQDAGRAVLEFFHALNPSEQT